MQQFNTTGAIRFWLKLFLSRHRQRLLPGALLALATALSGIALLALSGWFITATALAGAALLLGAAFTLDIYLPGGGIRFFALSRTVSRYFERLYNHDTVLRQLAQSRVALFQGLQQLPRNASRGYADADWLSRLTAELDTLDNLYLRVLLPPLVTLLATLVFFAVLAIWLPLFALLMFSLLLLVLLVSGRIFCQRNIQQGAVLAEHYTQARAAVVEHLDGIAELYASKAVVQYQLPLQQLTTQIGQLENKLQQLQARLQLGLNSLQALVFSALLISVLQACAAGILSGPVAVMFILGWLGVAELLVNLPLQLSHLGKTVYAARRLASFAQLTPSPVQTMAPITQIACSITKHPQISSSCQQPLTFALTPQQPWLLFSGASGSGKSTLAQCLLAADSTTPVQLSVNQQSLTQPEVALYQQHIAYLEQQNAIFADTLRYNLQLGLPAQPEALLWQQLKRVELDEWAKALPQGLDSWLGDAGQNISGGQARRLSLARLMLRNPRLVILDEPFNGLDQPMAERLWQNILPWLQGRFVVLLLHKKPASLHSIDLFTQFKLSE